MLLNTDPETACRYARNVFDEIAKMRGWSPGDVPKNVASDIWIMLGESRVYSNFYRRGVPPKEAAEFIQNARWNLGHTI